MPKEFELYGIRTIEEANKYLKEIYIPRHNEQFSVKAKEEKLAYVSWNRDDLKEILCIKEERQVQHDNTVSYKGIHLQIPRDDLRHHYVKTKVEVHEYADGSLSLFYGPRCLGRYNAQGHLEREDSLCKAA